MKAKLWAALHSSLQEASDWFAPKEIEPEPIYKGFLKFEDPD